jgi:D-glycero-D-manno-heptose 1,7-bisphosphate phosphatase
VSKAERREADRRAIQSSADVPLQPAVFLDRDGTIIDDVGYLDRIDDVVVYPWSADALRLLKRGGFAIVVITNQSGVGRGLYPETVVQDVHAHLAAELARGGVTIDAWHHCPHLPDAVDAAYRLDCECRKPKPGMLIRAAADLGLDLSRSVVVGDRWSDVAAGHAVGAAGVLVQTGVGAKEARTPPDGLHADAIVPSLIEAAGWILRERR